MRYAIIDINQDNRITNIIEANAEIAEKFGAVKLDDKHGIGDFYKDGKFCTYQELNSIETSLDDYVPPQAKEA